jgi:ribosomal protein L34E
MSRSWQRLPRKTPPDRLVAVRVSATRACARASAGSGRPPHSLDRWRPAQMSDSRPVESPKVSGAAFPMRSIRLK